MRRTRRPQIPQRRRVFVGCEGESERGYIVRLGQLLDERGCHVHLDPVLLRGGDPLSLLRRAEKGIRRGERRGAYEIRAALLDHDRVGQSPTRDSDIDALASKLRLTIIWQRTCHEALLLRHLPDCAALLPGTTEDAGRRLAQCWPGYSKPMSARDLRSQIDMDAVERARKVESELDAFLKSLGW